MNQELVFLPRKGDGFVHRRMTGLQPVDDALNRFGKRLFML